MKRHMNLLSLLAAVLAAAANLPLRLDVAARSDPGLERESNQDSFLVVEPGAKAVWALLAVCDGMGGAAGGDVASQLAVDVLRDVMTGGAAPTTRDALGRRLLNGVEEASRRIFAAARTMHGPPMSMFSIASASVAPAFATVCSNG